MPIQKRAKPISITMSQYATLRKNKEDLILNKLTEDDLKTIVNSVNKMIDDDFQNNVKNTVDQMLSVLKEQIVQELYDRLVKDVERYLNKRFNESK